MKVQDLINKNPTLDIDDLIALRQSKLVSFIHNPKKPYLGMFILSFNEKLYKIEVASRIANLNSNEYECRLTLENALFCVEWKTIVYFFQEDDELELLWIIDMYSNSESEEVGIHADCLKLDVYRKGQLHGSFLIGVYLAKNPNNRMIKKL